MSDAVAVLLGLGAWAVIFVPLFILWHLPERRRTQRLRAASAARQQRLDRRAAR